MIEYIIKSSICLAILYLAYIILQSKSTNYKTNRILLLSSVVFSLLVPLLNFSLSNFDSQEVVANGVILNAVTTVTDISNNIETINTHNIRDFIILEYISIIYVLIGLVLLAKFIRNLFVLIFQYFTSDKINYHGQSVILVNKSINPYSFLKTIYINKQIYKNNAIDKDLMLHETAHTKQLHSIDILCIELLQVVFWFNPFIYLFKVLIRKNHEFLADDYVIRSGTNKIDYSNKLLDFTFRNKSLSLASGFNYSLIKNRLIMLSQKDHKKRYAFQTFIFIPLGVILFITTAFTNTSAVFQNIFNVNPNESCLLETYENEDEGGYIINGNTEALYSMFNDRYLISKEPISGTFSGDNHKTIVELENYKFKETDLEIFIDNKKVGTVQNDDFIILHHEKRVDVYSKERVQIND